MKVEEQRLPRLTRMQKQKYLQMRVIKAEMSRLNAALRDRDKAVREIAGELEELFGDRVTMRLDALTLLVRDQVKVDAETIKRPAYSYTKWVEKRG